METESMNKQKNQKIFLSRCYKITKYFAFSFVCLGFDFFSSWHAEKLYPNIIILVCTCSGKITTKPHAELENNWYPTISWTQKREQEKRINLLDSFLIIINVNRK